MDSFGPKNNFAPSIGELKYTPSSVILRDLEEFTYEEIADMLKLPLGTVKSRINRGRAELARILGKMKDRL